MPDLYVAAYLARGERRRSAHPSRTAIAVYNGALAGRFPYDCGDDPAFCAANYHKGPVTWGVCRADVRNAISPGDWIAFLSAERDGEDEVVTRYRFVAALCVERKISHTAIFETSRNRRYRDYLNLLVRP